MAWFDFMKDLLLGTVKKAANNKDLQGAIVGGVRDLAKVGLDKLNKGDIEGAKAALMEQDRGAEAIAGAMVKGTPAEKMVDPSIVHGTPEATAAQE